MDFITQFREQNFIGRINLLMELGKAKGVDHLPELFFLYDLLTGDKAVDVMIENTLRGILAQQEKETIKKIGNGTPKEKKLSLRIASEKHFSSAIAPIIHLVGKEKDPELIAQALLVMLDMKSPLCKGIAREFLFHPDEVVAAIAIEMAGIYNETDTIPHLQKILAESESDHRYEMCDLPTAKAVAALEAMGRHHGNGIDVLVSFVHHRNPTARRLIAESLVQLGSAAIPFIEDRFDALNPHQQIMTANIIGRIGKKRGARILVHALKAGTIKNQNVKSAIFEALGHIPYSHGTALLAEAVMEDEPQFLMTIIDALNQRVEPIVGLKLIPMVKNNSAAAERIFNAVIDTCALNLFDIFYNSEYTREALVKTLTGSANGSRGCFAKIAHTIAQENPKLRTYFANPQPPRPERTITILAVDDLNCLRLFYRSVLTKIDPRIVVHTAENGNIAMEMLREQREHPFDLIITDMNMPVMDGIEFIREARKMEAYKQVPIILGSTESGHDQTRLAIKSGVDDVLLKPIKPETLEEKINFFLSPSLSKTTETESRECGNDLESVQINPG